MREARFPQELCELDACKELILHTNRLSGTKERGCVECSPAAVAPRALRLANGLVRAGFRSSTHILTSW